MSEPKKTLVEGLKMEEGASEPDWWTEAAQDVIRHAKTDSSPDWRNAIVGGLLRAYNRGKDAAAQHLKREQGSVRCNRCQANLCEHDNCTDWTCARACSKCAKGPREQEPAQQRTEFPWAIETMRLIDVLTPDTKGKAFDPDWFLLRQRLEEFEAAQPPQELVSAAVEEYKRSLDVPELEDFNKGVLIEAQHQRQRWGNDHDENKEPEEWFWVIGYLAGKALRAQRDGDMEKFKHHLITGAALLSNWHARARAALTRGAVGG